MYKAEVERDQALLTKSSLAITLQEETAEDKKLASLLKYRATDCTYMKLDSKLFLYTLTVRRKKCTENCC